MGVVGAVVEVSSRVMVIHGEGIVLVVLSVLTLRSVYFLTGKKEAQDVCGKVLLAPYAGYRSVSRVKC